MPTSPDQSEPATKGERTAQRILIAAETLFAEQGYNNASLRDVAREAGIQVPGLYKYFASKEALYEKVLEACLKPIEDALEEALCNTNPDTLSDLPSTMADIFCVQPNTARLFQQVLMSHEDNAGKQIVRKWLSRFLKQGAQLIAIVRPDKDKKDIEVLSIALFNLTVGYFVSQGILDLFGKGSILDEAYVERHKNLVNDWIRTQLQA